MPLITLHNNKQIQPSITMLDIPLLLLTSPPNLRVLLSTELTPELRSSPRTDQALICSCIAYLIFFSPKPISNSTSRISGCFSSCLPRLPLFRDFESCFLLFLAFYLFPTTLHIIGEIQIFPQKSKLEINSFKDF